MIRDFAQTDLVTVNIVGIMTLLSKIRVGHLTIFSDRCLYVYTSWWKAASAPVIHTLCNMYYTECILPVHLWLSTMRYIPVYN